MTLWCLMPAMSACLRSIGRSSPIGISASAAIRSWCWKDSSKADVFMRIYNADGGEVESCGNASRCVGWRVLQEMPGRDAVTIETLAGVIEARK